MNYRLVFVFVVTFLIVLPPFYAQDSVQVTTDDAWVDFPEAVDFHLVATAVSPVESVVLKYGVDALTCGSIINRSEIPVDESESIDVSWRWYVLQGDLIPPGAQVWWRWLVTLDDGTVFTTPEQRKTFLDDWFVWQEIEADNLTLHWYRGSQAMAQRILAAAVSGKQTTAEEIGLELADPIDIYLYDEPTDLQISVPGAPAWAGGVAFPEHNILLITADDEHVEYGESTARHEMSHMVVGRFLFDCVSSLPTWLSEGLAQVSEGDLDEAAEVALAKAVANDDVLTLAQLTGSFSAHSDQATLSYAQSYSFVRYLLDTYEQEGTFNLLSSLQNGDSLDKAVITAYGQELSVLENDWRGSLGLTPLMFEMTADVEATSSAVPTLGLMVAETPAPASSTAPLTTKSPTPMATMTPKADFQETAVTPVPSSTQTITQPASSESNPGFLFGGLGIILVVALVFGSIVYLRSKTDDS